MIEHRYDRAHNHHTESTERERTDTVLMRYSKARFSGDGGRR